MVLSSEELNLRGQGCPAAPRNWYFLDQRKEESVFRPFPTSGAIYRPEAAAITGGQQAVAWEATCVLSSPSRL